MPSSVLISGATGFLGSALSDRLRGEGWSVHRLTRGVPGPGDRTWDPAHGQLEPRALDGIDVVVHLAGEPIAQRWTAARKQRIRESRIGGTALLARALAGLPRPPAAMLSASAIGYYGDRGEEELSEASTPGSGFLARVSAEWEDAAEPARAAGMRLTLLRTGIVLSPRGGALAKMLPPFRLGAGGRIGNGQQWMSWIALHDWVRAVDFLLANDVAGPVNLVSPNPVRNAAFTKTLGRVLERPTLVPVPAAAIHLLFGDMGRDTLLTSQRVHPQVLMDAGFPFEYPTLEPGLRAELEPTRSAR